jgi:hypothetical protein
MSRLLLNALVVLLLLGPSSGATEENPPALPEVRVVDTDPPAGQNLSRDWPLYVHLTYESETALRVQVKGFLRGIEVKDGVSWNPSPAYAAGTGEAIAWIAFSKPTHLDELRIEVSDAGWNDLLGLKVPMNVAWTALASQRPDRAEWVPRLSDAQQKVTQEDMAKIGNNPLGYLLGTLAMLSVPGYFVLQIVFALAWSGRWRIVALAPLVVMLPAMGHAAFALSAGSNIWPIVVILVAPFCCVYLVVAAVVRHLARARIGPAAGGAAA